MAYDRSRIPVKTVLFALAVGGLAPQIWPFLMPVPWNFGHESVFFSPPWLGRLDSSFLGLSLGFVVGGLMGSWLEPNRAEGNELAAHEDNGCHLAIGLMAIGLFLGWQAVVTTAAWFALCVTIAKLSGWQRKAHWPPLCWLSVACLIQLVGWIWWQRILTQEQPIWELSLAAGLAIFATVAVGLTAGRATETRQAIDSDQS